MKARRREGGKRRAEGKNAGRHDGVRYAPVPRPPQACANDATTLRGPATRRMPHMKCYRYDTNAADVRLLRLSLKCRPERRAAYAHEAASVAAAAAATTGFTYVAAA